MGTTHDLKIVFDRFSRRARVFMWESGQGQILNALPEQFGNQLVLSLPEQELRLPLHYFERDGIVYTFLNDSEGVTLSQAAAENCAIEVWMKNGWFTASASVLNEEETADLLSGISSESLFGTIGCRLPQSGIAGTQIAALKRKAPRTGGKGPGGRSWVWFAASALFFTLWFKDRKK